MVSFTDISVQLAPLWTGITCIQINFDRVYTHLDTLATKMVSLLFAFPFQHLRKMLKYIKRCLAQHAWIAFPNDPNQDIWSYCKLLWINVVSFDDHLVIILQVPLVSNSLFMNGNKVYNLFILHPTLQNTFHYSAEGEYMVLLSDDDYATIPSEYDMFTCVFTRVHRCQFDTALFPTEKVS